MVTDYWTIRHFSQSNPSGPGQADIPVLLRRVATSIEELGAVEVQDITFHGETDLDGKPWPQVTVYFDSPEQPSDP